MTVNQCLSVLMCFVFSRTDDVTGGRDCGHEGRGRGQEDEVVSGAESGQQQVLHPSGLGYMVSEPR